MIRVVISEDQNLVLGALAALLKLESDFDVVGVAADGAAAFEQVLALQPDILVTDIEMPRLTGIELAAKVTAQVPHTRIVIVAPGRRGPQQRRDRLGAGPVQRHRAELSFRSGQQARRRQSHRSCAAGERQGLVVGFSPAPPMIKPSLDGYATGQLPAVEDHRQAGVRNLRALANQALIRQIALDLPFGLH